MDPDERLPSRARCRQIHSNDTVPLGRTFFRSSREAIESIENPYARETGCREGVGELCFQQSTGDSTGPEVDITKSAVGKEFADNDVRDLHAPSAFQHARDLADSLGFIGHEVEHAVRHDDIDR